MGRAKKIEVFVGVVGAIVGVVGLLLSIYNFIDAKEEKKEQDIQQQEILSISNQLLNVQEKISNLEEKKLKLQASLINDDIEIISTFNKKSGYFIVDIIGSDNLEVNVFHQSGLFGIHRYGEFNVIFKDVCVRRVPDSEKVLKSFKCIDLEIDSGFDDSWDDWARKERKNLSESVNNLPQAYFYSLFKVSVENKYLDNESFAKYFHVDVVDKKTNLLSKGSYDYFLNDRKNNSWTYNVPINKADWELFFEQSLLLIK